MRHPMTMAAPLAGLILLLAACSSDAPGGSACNPGEVETMPDSAMPTNAQIFEWVADLTGFGKRRIGSEALARTEAYMLCMFRAFGLEDVHLEESWTWHWEAEDWGLAIEGESVDSFYIYQSFVTPDEPSEFSTGPDGLTAELVDVGDGSNISAADVEGKIVVWNHRFLVPVAGLLLEADFLWDPMLTILDPPGMLLQANPYITNMTSVMRQLQDAGAVGVIGVLADYYDSNRFHNEFYRAQDFTVPGVWVTPREGQRIRDRLADASGPVTANLRLDGFRRAVPAYYVMGFLHGESKETIQIQSHHDSVWEGGVQDASGVGGVLALAHYFANQPPESRNKTLMFTTFSGHWSGYQPHNHFVEKYVENEETPYRIVANATVEHIGRHGVLNSAGELEITDHPEPRGFLNTLSVALRLELINAVIRNDLRRAAVLRTNLVGMPTDASFVNGAGVPTVSLISGPLYLYGEEDTLDLVAKDELQPVSQAFAEIIEVMDGMAAEDIGQGGLGGVGGIVSPVLELPPSLLQGLGSVLDEVLGVLPLGTIAAAMEEARAVEAEAAD